MLTKDHIRAIWRVILVRLWNSNELWQATIYADDILPWAFYLQGHSSRQPINCAGLLHSALFALIDFLGQRFAQHWVAMLLCCQTRRFYIFYSRCWDWHPASYTKHTKYIVDSPELGRSAGSFRLMHAHPGIYICTMVVGVKHQLNVHVNLAPSYSVRIGLCLSFHYRFRIYTRLCIIIK